MKLVTFEHQTRMSAGVWLDHEVVDLGVSMMELLQDGQGIPDRVSRLMRSAPRVPASAVRILAPVPRPGKIICVGQNYLDHCREQKVDPPTSPILFAKFNNAVSSAGAAIRLPALSQKIDYEAELAFVIGKGGRHIEEAGALDHIAGYTCVNDVSARDIQAFDKQWTRAKSFDTFCPMGPFLVTSDEIPDPQALSVRCTVSGEVLQDSSTSLMIFSCAFLISFISRSITLEAGDLVTTGTPHGVGVFRNPQRFLRSGDTVTVSIERVGDLTNPVISDEA